jgi:hypothetical protein
MPLLDYAHCYGDHLRPWNHNRAQIEPPRDRGVTEADQLRLLNTSFYAITNHDFREAKAQQKMSSFPTATTLSASVKALW